MKHILYFEPDPFFEHEMSVEIADDLVLRGIIRPIPRGPSIQGYLPTDNYRHLNQKQMAALADGVEVADSALFPTDDFLDDDELGDAINGLTLLIAGLRRDGRNDETAESARRKLAIHRRSRRSLRLRR